MPSLYHHEYISHTYAELSDEELNKHAREIQELKDSTEVPRQRQVCDRLLGLIAFEASYRLGVGNGEVQSTTAG
jgi:hypothetical protein